MDLTSYSKQTQYTEAIARHHTRGKCERLSECACGSYIAPVSIGDDSFCFPLNGCVHRGSAGNTCPEGGQTTLTSRSEGDRSSPLECWSCVTDSSQACGSIMPAAEQALKIDAGPLLCHSCLHASTEQWKSASLCPAHYQTTPHMLIY